MAEGIARFAGIFRRYRAAFGVSPPLKHWDASRGSDELFELMEEAIARGRPLSEEELGGGYPEGRWSEGRGNERQQRHGRH
jgi:hypothetical protein